MVDVHWADVAASKIIKEKGNKKQYVCASGITPSGTIHMGNFREVITTALVAQALKDKGKNVKFIYSWDDFDRFRKIPAGISEEFNRYIGMPLSLVPDPHKCHKSWAEHFEKKFEESIKVFDFDIKFIRQSEMYGKCKYAHEIKWALNHKKKIIEILNKYRREPLDDNWIPLIVYCEKCKRDTTKVLKYDGEYEISYECACGNSGKIDFRKKGVVKVPWRICWPMRQNYEKVDFEPGGKDHYAAGGARITTNEIIEAVWNRKHVTDLAYEWIAIKGGKQFSSSAGVITTVKDVLEVYEPEIIKWFFAGTRPNVEFRISFDLDVIKYYEDFDYAERVYYEKEKVTNKKELLKQKRIYELSSIKLDKQMPKRVGFRHLTNLLQINEGKIDSKMDKVRAKCALNWLKKYAPEDMKFKVHEGVSNEIKALLNGKQKKALKLLAKKLENKYSVDELFNEFYMICEELGLKNTEFFKAAYLVLIGKERGPKLAPFILSLGQNRVKKLLEQI